MRIVGPRINIEHPSRLQKRRSPRRDDPLFRQPDETESNSPSLGDDAGHQFAGYKIIRAIVRSGVMPDAAKAPALAGKLAKPLSNLAVACTLGLIAIGLR